MAQTDLLELELEPPVQTTLDIGIPISSEAGGALAPVGASGITERPFQDTFTPQHHQPESTAPVIDAEWRTVAPQEFESRQSWAERQRQEWRAGDERLIQDLADIDADYNQTIANIEGEFSSKPKGGFSPTQAGRSVGLVGAAIELGGAFLSGEPLTFETVGSVIGGTVGSAAGTKVGAKVGKGILAATAPTGVGTLPGGIAAGSAPLIGGTVGAIGGSFLGGTVGSAIDDLLAEFFGEDEYIPIEDIAQPGFNIVGGVDQFDPDNPPSEFDFTVDGGVSIEFRTVLGFSGRTRTADIVAYRIFNTPNGEAIEITLCAGGKQTFQHQPANGQPLASSIEITNPGACGEPDPDNAPTEPVIQPKPVPPVAPVIPRVRPPVFGLPETGLPFGDPSPFQPIGNPFGDPTGFNPGFSLPDTITDPTTTEDPDATRPLPTGDPNPDNQPKPISRPSPIDLPAPDFPVTTTPEIAPDPNPLPLPTIDPPRTRPGQDPITEPPPDPRYRPTGRPAPAPIVGPDPTGGTRPGTKPTINPNDEPQLDPIDPPAPREREAGTPQECDPCAKIDALTNLIKQELAASLVMLPCEEGDASAAFAGQASGAGFAGVNSTLQLVLAGLQTIWEQVKCPPEAIASVPESFLTKAPTIKPQLQVQYKEAGSAKGSRWHITIPHFNEALRDSIQLRSYQKGNVRCSLTLADNSRIVVNAVSESEGRAVIDEILPYVLPAFRSPIDNMTVNKIPSRNFATVNVESTYALYFSGNLNNPPQWTRKLTT